MKKLSYILGTVIAIILATGIVASAAPITLPVNGGTGTGSKPSYGQVLIGNSGGTYTPTATSSLGIPILSGGTAGMLTAWTGALGLTATSGPTAAYFTGTSTTATSSFAGPLIVSGWEVGTSTTVCPDGQPVGCRYYGGGGLVQAVNVDKQKNVRLKCGIYTIPGPILPDQSGFTLTGDGDCSAISYNGTGIKIAIMSGNLSLELGNMYFGNFRVNETGAGGRSTCMDLSRIVTTKVDHVHCDKHLFGFMASTGQSYYNTFDTDDVTHLTSAAGVNPLSSVAFYFGDNGSGDGGPIDTTIINAHVTQLAAGSSTSYYFNSHSIKCLNCNSEGGYTGMRLGPNASDSNLGVYLEANKINLTMDASLAEVGGVNITGNISDASPLSGNIVDNGVAALCVNARVQYAGVNYCTNVKQGFGTNIPRSTLEVSDRDEAQTPGLHTATAGLFGSNGPAIALTRGGVSERFLVNPSLSATTTASLDFVLATSTYAGNENSGVRFAIGNAIGTTDVLIQPEVQNDGYAIFEGYSSTTISGSTAGTAISSRNSPVLLAPNRTPLVYATTGSKVGIATSSPSSTFSVQGNQFIAGNIVSTSTLASVFPYASTTGITSTGSALFATGSGSVGIATTTPWRTLSVTGTLAVNGLSAFATGDSAVCQRAGGEITVDSGVSSCIVSTRAVKHNIASDVFSTAISRLTKLNPVTFNYNGSNKADIGLLAEDVAQIDPRYAQYNKDKPRAINWSAITADMVKVLQNVLARLDGNEKKLDALQKQVNSQQKEIDAIKSKLK